MWGIPQPLAPLNADAVKESMDISECKNAVSASYNDLRAQGGGRAWWVFHKIRERHIADELSALLACEEGKRVTGTDTKYRSKEPYVLCGTGNILGPDIVIGTQPPLLAPEQGGDVSEECMAFSQMSPEEKQQYLLENPNESFNTIPAHCGG